MRSSTRAWASSSDLQFYLVSTSDTIALSFGFVSTLIAIATVFVTRRTYQIPCSYFIYSSLQIHASTALTSFCSAAARDLEQFSTPHLGSATQAQGDMVIEEMRLRRWSMLKRNVNNTFSGWSVRYCAKVDRITMGVLLWFKDQVLSLMEFVIQELTVPQSNITKEFSS